MSRPQVKKRALRVTPCAGSSAGTCSVSDWGCVRGLSRQQTGVFGLMAPRESGGWQDAVWKEPGDIWCRSSQTRADPHLVLLDHHQPAKRSLPTVAGGPAERQPGSGR